MTFSDEEKEFLRDAIEQMTLGRVTPGREGREMLLKIRDKLGDRMGLSKEEQIYLQAFVQWTRQDASNADTMWEEVGLSEMGLHILSSMVDDLIENDDTVNSLSGQPAVAWKMGFLVGLVAEHQIRQIIEENSHDA
jgi:hypothetical protein